MMMMMSALYYINTLSRIFEGIILGITGVVLSIWAVIG
jgi:hypothetical protein